MVNGSIITSTGKVILLNRGYKSSPDYTVPSVFQVGTGQTTPMVSDTQLTGFVTISTGVTSKSFVAGYPTFNETKREVTIRGYLSSTDANGYNINGSGIKNSQGNLTSIDAFTAESKSSSDEFAFIWVDRII